MKKILISVLAVCSAMAFTGCYNSERSYLTSYVYKNNSSWDITIVSYFPPDDSIRKFPEATFTIPIGGSHKLSFLNDGAYVPPFSWLGSLFDTDSVAVSNGEKLFGYTRYSEFDDNKLFREESYELIERDEKHNNRTYRYVFTDKDFENGIPVE